MTEKVDKTAKYSLSLPGAMMEDIKRVTVEEQVTIIELLRTYIKFGLVFHRMKKADPSTQIVIRQEGKNDQIVLFL